MRLQLSFLVLFAIFSQALFGQIPTNCLIYDGTFDSTIVDQGPNNVSSIASSPLSFSSDRFGNPHGAVAFDGVDDYITLNNDSAIINTTSYSISAWCFRNTTNGGGTNNQHWIFQQRSDNTSGTLDLLLINPERTNGNTGFFINNSSMTSQVVLEGTPPPIQQWNHYALVVDGTIAKAYINGVGVGVTTIPLATYSNIDHVSLARHMYAESQTTVAGRALLNGRLDDVKIFNCALSQQEVEYLYCPAKALISQNDTIIEKGSALLFENLESSPYNTWIINGIQASSDSAFTQTFNSEGIFQLILETTDGFCTNSDTSYVRVLPPPTCLGTNSISKISADSGNLTASFNSQDRFGNGTASIPDLNGNGINELIIGAPGNNDGGNNAGAVYVLYPNDSSQISSHVKISSTSGNFGSGLSAGDQFGQSVDYIGDLNNDGYPDLVVGTPFSNDGGSQKGAIWILFLDSAAQVSSKQKISDTQGGLLEALSTGDKFGFEVAGIGDINNDGFEDIAVGSVHDFVNSNLDGSVYILFLNANGTVSSEIKLNRNTPLLSSVLNESGMAFGHSIELLGDLNGDGINEFAFGATDFNGNGINKGATIIASINSSGTVTAAHRITEGENGFNQSLDNNSNFGSSVASLGDIDNDGYIEIGVSAWRDNTGGTERGALWVCSLDSSGYVFNTVKINNSSNLLNGYLDNNDLFGRHVGVAGDINNDGWNDLIVGATGDDDGSPNAGAIYLVSMRDTCCPMIPSFTGLSDVCENNSTTFTNTSTGATNNASYAWYINDTLVANSSDLTYAFNNAGNYLVKLVVNDICTKSFTQQITAHSPSVADAGSSTFICFGDSIQLSASGGIDYQWNNTNTLTNDSNHNPIAFPSTTTIYTVTVTDQYGCSDVDNVAIVVNSLPTFTVSGDSLVCPNETFTLSANNTSLSYSWHNVLTPNIITTGNPVQLSSQNSTFIIAEGTDLNGCSDTVHFAIAIDTSLSVSVSAFSNSLCYQSNDGYIAVSSSGGTPNYTYSWSNGSSNDTVANLSPSTFQVTVTDDKGCTNSVAQTITEPDSISNSFTVDSVLCFNGSSGSIIASPSGGTPNYSFNWNTGSTSSTISNQPVGTYTLTVTDNNGCSNTFNETIFEPTVLSSSVTINQHVSCFGGSDGSATISVSGGVSPYTYTWSNGGISSTETNLAVGSHIITITDANMCTHTDSVVVLEPSLLVGTTTVNNQVTCFGYSNGIATANPSGGTSPYSYQWSSGENIQQASMLVAGINTVTITDTLGCFTTISTTITQPTAVQAVLDSTKNVLCNGFYDGLAFTSSTGGTGSHSFMWNTGDTNNNIDSLTSGIYILTVTDSLGCFDTTSVSIVELTPVIPNISGVNISCYSYNDGSSQTSAIGGGGSNYSYLWSTGDTSPSIVNLIANTYWVSVTDEFNCNTIDTIILTQPDSIQFAFDVVDISCENSNDGEIVATVSGGTRPYSYSWQTGESDSAINMLDSGFFALEITDVNGCNNTDSAYIFEPSLLTVQTQLIDSVDCFGNSNGAAFAIANGGVGNYNYTWNSGELSDSISNKSSQTYLVTVTDSNSCSAIDSILINEPALLTLSIDSLNHVSCKNELNGFASVLSLGGNGSYIYNWNTGSSSNFISNLVADTYTVTITDLRGCVDSISAIVLEPDSLISQISYVDTLTCQYNGDGSLTTLVSGGTLPYSYQWSNGVATAKNSGLSDGIYKVTITDANGCIDSSQFVINAQSHITSKIDSVYNILCNGDQSGYIEASADSGAIPYTFTWSNGNVGSSNSNLNGGNYQYTVSDLFGCVDSGNSFVFEPTLLETSVDSVKRIFCFGDDDGTILTSSSGGVTPYIWTWSNGADSNFISSLDSGVYAYTVTDANGCITSDSARILEPSLPISNNFNIVDVSCLGGANGEITSIPNGGTIPFNFNWTTGDSSASALNLIANTYIVTISDSFNCVFVDTTSVNEPAAPDTAVIQKSDITCYGYNDGILSAQFVNGTAPYLHTWSNSANTSTIQNLLPGVYNVFITDSIGCTQVAFDTIHEPDTLIATISQTNNILCFGEATASLHTAVVGGSMPYTYLWENGQQTQGIVDLPIGNYTVTVTDINGCTDSSLFNIQQPDSLQITSLIFTDASCNGFSDANGFVEATGGTQPYEYTWSSGENQDSALLLSGGSQSIQITDANGCITDSTFIVSEPSTLEVAVIDFQATNCDNSYDGSISVSSTGGNGGYQYTWSTNATNSIITNVNSGNYSVTVLDSKGCTDSTQLFLPYNNNSPIVTLGNDTFFCEIDQFILIENSEEVDKIWNTGDNSDSIIITETGEYWIQLTDSNNCISSDTVTIEKVFPTPIELGMDSILCTDFGVTPVTIGAEGFETYSWNTGETTSFITVNQTGKYAVSVTNEYGCANSDSINLSYQFCFDPIIYPVPATEVLYVEWPRQLYQNISFSIISSTGALVWKSKAGSEQIHELLLKQLNPGAYFLIIEGEQFKLEERILISN